MIDRLMESILAQAALPEWLQQLKLAAGDRLNYLKLPTAKDEEWRNFDLQKDLNDLQKLQNPAGIAPANPVDFLAPHILPEAAESLITCLDGKFSIALSALEGLPQGVLIGGLQNFEQLGIDLAATITPHLGKYVDPQDYFAALNTAAIADVIVVYIPAGLDFSPTLQILFASEQSIICQPRCLVILEPGSSLNLVETYIGGDFPHFCNALVEIYISHHSRLNHTMVQRDSRQGISLNNWAIAQAEASTYTTNTIVLGAKKSRSNLQIHQQGSYTETLLHGLTLISGDQIADTHSAIAHNFPQGTSQQLHKCIADEQAHGIFNGKILVAPAAQLTNSKQLSRNLLLSPKARIDTKPQLEIFADNVKCAHGATISQIDGDELFYLQSRCIDLDSAKNLLTYGFAAEVIGQIPVNSLKENLSQMMQDQASYF